MTERLFSDTRHCRTLLELATLAPPRVFYVRLQAIATAALTADIDRIGCMNRSYVVRQTHAR